MYKLSFRYIFKFISLSLWENVWKPAFGSLRYFSFKRRPIVCFDYQLKLDQKVLKKETLNFSCDGYPDCPPLINVKKNIPLRA